MRLAALRQRNSLILYDADSLSDAAVSHQLHPSLFREDYWRERQWVIGEAPGRGSSLFLQANHSQQWVLRPYQRGGMAAKISKNRYLWLGEERTRAFRELRLTAQLFTQRLPVPQPVACCVTRYGCTYEAALLTVRIPGAKALASRLCDNTADETLLKRVGAMIQRFHRQGLDHVDLNARNILIDPENQPWLIDLDRCRLRRPGSWQAHNLARLARSVAKFSAANQADAIMSHIQQGYTQPDDTHEDPIH